jgi:hypothetical protein
MGQAQDTNTANHWTSKASSYYSEKSYDLALDSVNKALNIDPTNKGALNLKGNILIGLGKFDEAITAFDKILSRNDRNKAAWKGKGYAFFRLGRYKDAVNCYDEVLRIDDSDAEALHYKALALSQLGEGTEATKLQERAVSIEPSYAFGEGSPGFRNVNIPVTTETVISPYYPGIDIECDWEHMSAESTVPGGILESNNLVAPGGIIRFSLIYSNSPSPSTPGSVEEIDPLNKDWARDVVVRINYNAEVYPGEVTIDPVSIAKTPRVTLVSASISPDSGTDNQWTIKNLQLGEEGRIDLTVRVPDELRNVWFSPFSDYYITWMDVEGGGSMTPIKLIRGPHDPQRRFSTLIEGPSGTWDFDFPSEAVFLLMGLPQISLAKSASSSSIAPGDCLVYNLNYKNLGGSGDDLAYWEGLFPPPLTDPPPPDPSWTRDITIVENYPPGVTFISAEPAPDPGTNNQWTIKNVAKGAGGTIKVTVKVPDAPPNIKFSYQEYVNGIGYMRSSKDMTTEMEPYNLINSVNVNYGRIIIQSATNSVTVREVSGTKLLDSESGSGNYSRESLINYNRQTNYIREVDDLSAKYSPTVFDLPKERSIKYNSKWGKKIVARNDLQNESVQDSYHYAQFISRQGTVELMNNSTRMELEADFNGLRHLDYRKGSNLTDRGHRSTIQGLSQDYAGSFKVSQLIESKFINRTNAITQIRKYDEPHITIYQRGAPDNSDPMKINYVVSILNDGNRALGPVHVRDYFPTGTYLLSSSIDTPSGDSVYGDWVFNDIPIDGSITIYLQVLIYMVIDPTINHVEVTALYDGKSVSAVDYLDTNANWLSCSSGKCLGNYGDWKQPCENNCISNILGISENISK